MESKKEEALNMFSFRSGSEGKSIIFFGKVELRWINRYVKICMCCANTEDKGHKEDCFIKELIEAKNDPSKAV